MSAVLSRARKPQRIINAKLRQRMEAAVEHMLALLDELDGDPEAEAYLGGTDARGVNDDRELDTDIEEDDTLDHGEVDDSDKEPSLGWTENGCMGFTGVQNADLELAAEVPPAERRGTGRRESICNVYTVEEQAAQLALDVAYADLGIRRASENVTVKSHILGGLEVIGPDGTRYRGVNLRGR